MRHVSLLIIHCSATPPSMDLGAKEIRQWHLDRGWSDIGYHYVIRRNGTVEPGRPLHRPGAHARGWNTRSIGICYVGGVDKQMEEKDNRTAAQKRALQGLVMRLRKDIPSILSVVGHRDLPGVRKACPSFEVVRSVYEEF